jgi:DNA-directed RNA polymerase subunit RPC12/RpoP
VWPVQNGIQKKGPSTKPFQHSGERPHACSVCDRSVTRKENLLVYRSMHSGKRPYVCGKCSKTFTIRSALIRHQQLQRRKRLYVCEMSGIMLQERQPNQT